MKKFRMLDLFCGLKGSSSAMVDDPDWEVVTVDIEKKFDPTICKDILLLDPRDFEDKDFDVIWASPPCNAFSMASVFRYWDKVNDVFLPRSEKTILNLNLVYRTLWLINELKPRFWFLENPRGMLHKFIGDPSGWVTYCQYGEKRMKPTNLWGVHPRSFKYKHCSYGSDCHIQTPRGSKNGTQGLGNSEERALIPFGLSLAIKESIELEEDPAVAVDLKQFFS